MRYHITREDPLNERRPVGLAERTGLPRCLLTPTPPNSAEAQFQILIVAWARYQHGVSAGALRVSHQMVELE